MSRTTLVDLRAAIQAGQRLVNQDRAPAHSDAVLGMARLVCEMFDLNPEVTSSDCDDVHLVREALSCPGNSLDWTVATLRQARSEAP